MIEFYKYHGAGNDFVIIDHTKTKITVNKKALAKKLCDRHFGVGSDGLIFIELADDCDFVMDFYNPDGSQSFCGNGSRCAVAFAKKLNVFSSNKAKFRAIDGFHTSEINEQHIKVSMHDVNEVEIMAPNIFMDTGSPHFVTYVNDLNQIDVIEKGKEIRYSEQFMPDGTNVNFIEIINSKQIAIRTYERGVENETLACGTGATACALAFALKQGLETGEVLVKAVGGDLKVFFKQTKAGYSNVFLEGPAEMVYKGEISEY